MGKQNIRLTRDPQSGFLGRLLREPFWAGGSYQHPYRVACRLTLRQMGYIRAGKRTIFYS
jgi:hypothetical protein